MAKPAPPQKIVTPSAEGLAAAAKASSGAKTGEPKLPPVHLWDPPFCGDIDMRIARDGTWFHDGTPIGRPAMVRLFAGILKREGEDYFLVTPVEKVGIRVDDAPFLAVDVEATGAGEGQALHFETLTGERMTAGPEHPIRVETRDGAPAPYVLVRTNLWALIDRKSFYRLAELCVPGAGGRDGVWSGGVFFPLEIA